MLIVISLFFVHTSNLFRASYIHKICFRSVVHSLGLNVLKQVTVKMNELYFERKGFGFKPLCGARIVQSVVCWAVCSDDIVLWV